ncbi:hypothetical protein [Povalibacter sp.]|uniref:hypothetical protein n=1 Tax=Povalibacter sp. TaxID=1962978 RepID=UPI002F417BCC
MSDLYLVVLLISQASGHVEMIEATGVPSQAACNNLGSLVQLSNKEGALSGYEQKLHCGSREALEVVIARNQCRAVSRKDSQGYLTSTYACEKPADWSSKLSSWVSAIWD